MNNVIFKTNGNFAIHVTDIQKAENFYSNVLGFQLVNKHFDQLEYDTGVVHLYINKDNQIIPFIPALEVRDCREAKEYLIKNGCEIIKEFNIKALYFKDPFGITIDIIEKNKSNR